MHPWPQVAAELGVLEKSRELIEGTSMRELQQEFNKVCDVALLGVAQEADEAASERRFREGRRELPGPHDPGGAPPPRTRGAPCGRRGGADDPTRLS